MKFSDGQFLTVEEISPRRSKTPEGYLLCEGVPISRTGSFEYTPLESGIKVPAGSKALISRTEEELFRPETMASFEGKPVVVGHARFADPSNWRQISVGTVQNVRRGEGDQSSLLLADLLLTDERAIALVESGELEEVSCGYDAKSIDDGDGRGHQVGIVGNHVALVERARCGPVCKIGDGFMTKPKSWKAAIRRIFKDGDDEALNAQLDELPNDLEQPKADEDPTPNAGDDRLTKLEAAVAALSEQVEKLMAVEKDEGHPELQGDEDPEQKADEETVADEGVCDEDEVKAVMSDAEDLCPGVERPQGDAADGKYSRALLERVKRNALKGSGVKFFGDSAELSGEALDVAFRGAVALKRAGRNPTAKPFGDTAGSRMSNADLNSKFKSFWEAK